MEKNSRILYPYANVMGIFFPEGKLDEGGTCQYFTPTCIKNCCSHFPGDGEKIGFENKRKTYNYFLDNISKAIANKIIKELNENNCNILTWFVSGDCPSFLENKFYSIIKIIDNTGIAQTGFTRNASLWEKCKELKNGKVLLTVENIGIINKEKVNSVGLYSIPNYKIGAIDIYRIFIDKKQSKSYGCGGAYYTYHIKDTEKEQAHLNLDCKKCYEEKIGCFLEN